MNLVFAVSARSVDGPSIFQKMKDVIKAIVQKFGSNRFHYSVITFGDPFTTELSFDQQFPSDDDLQRVIGKTSVNAKRFHVLVVQNGIVVVQNNGKEMYKKV